MFNAAARLSATARFCTDKLIPKYEESRRNLVG